MRTNTLTHTSHAASISLSLSLCLCIHHHASFSGCSWTIETAWVTTAASGELEWMFHDVKLPTLCLWLIYGILNNITHTCAPFYLSSSLLISLKFKWADFGSSVFRYIWPKTQHRVTTLKDQIMTLYCSAHTVCGCCSVGMYTSERCFIKAPTWTHSSCCAGLSLLRCKCQCKEKKKMWLVHCKNSRWRTWKIKCDQTWSFFVCGLMFWSLLILIYLCVCFPAGVWGRCGGSDQLWFKLRSESWIDRGPIGSR